MTTQDAIDKDWQQAEEDAEDNYVFCFVCGAMVREKEYPGDFTGRHWRDHLNEKCAECQEDEEDTP